MPVDSVAYEQAAGDKIAPPPQKDSISAKALQSYYESQYMNGLARRKNHALSWIRVRSIMRGIHYFRIRGGLWERIPKKKGQVRAILPIMKPMFRQELGRLNANQIGITTYPSSGSKEYIYKADRAYNLLTAWIDEACVSDFFDQANQYLLFEGMCGYYRYQDKFRQQVHLRPLPQSELFPLPYDSRNWEEMSGLMHVTMATKSWLEQQDMIREAVAEQNGEPPPKKMASKAGTLSTSMSINLPVLDAGSGEGSKMEGAVVKTAWNKPSVQHPNGEYLFFVGDELFIYSDAEGVLFNNKIPVEPVYYIKQPDDWWGYGFCEELIPQQMSANRQMTAIEHSSVYGKGFSFYDPSTIDLKNLMVEESGLVPLRGGPFEKEKPPFMHIPPTSVGRDVGVTLDLIRQYADFSAGYSSGIVYGQQEGRTDSFQATSLLNSNAQSPITPTLNRIFHALKRTFPEVLDMLREVWGPDKTLRLLGQNNLGREVTLNQGDFKEKGKWSDGVMIEPTPLLPNGRNSLVNMLFQLRNMPGQDGVQGSEISSREFRTSLRALGLAPPGLESGARPEQRIQARINALINDGQTPAIQPANPGNDGDRLVMEDHKMALEMLRDVILPESFMMYARPVQQALMQEFKFHKDLTFGGSQHPNAFDNSLEMADADMIEDYLTADEADLLSNNAEFGVLDGL
jgi:hypothetical protein